MTYQIIGFAELYLTAVSSLALVTLLAALYVSRKAFDSCDWDDDSRGSFRRSQEVLNWSASWFFVSGFLWTALHLIKYGLAD